MTRSIPVLLLSLLLLTFAPAIAAEDYGAMVERLKKGDTTVDYRALREAYAASPKYQPYGGSFDDTRQAMRKAFAAKDCPNAIANGEKVLNEIYIDLLSHALIGRCYDNANNKPKADFHRAVGRGLVASVSASGDGKTPETAFIVVTIDEEYDLLSTRNLNLISQSLVHSGGHSFDRVEVQDNGGRGSTVFFQIDAPLRWLSSSLTK